nr:DNA topoisomerase IB [Rubricella aquisinus]
MIYYPDTRPGITRRRAGRGWSYTAPDGTRIDAETERARLNALAVPPAYEDVWLCPEPLGHLQATGRDARARKQYRYHPDWATYRARAKYDGLAAFGERLPALRRRIAEGLRADAGEERLALAAVLALLDRGALRLGHPDYTAENGSYGATTLRSDHLDVAEGRIALRYTAKGGRRVRKSLTGSRLARAFQKFDDLPGAELITWLDDAGRARMVRSDQVNALLAEVAGDGTTAKTFRTWHGTLAAFITAHRADGPLTIKDMAEAAAARLHNTVSIARDSYIHPDVIALTDLPPEARIARLDTLRPTPRAGLRQGEAALRALLTQ